MRWCTNDCHQKSTWCNRMNCFNRSDYAVANRNRFNSNFENKNKNKETGKLPLLEDFKIVLAAMTPYNGFKTIKSLFPI